MHGTYDPILVALSVLIATLASYVALDLAGRITAAGGRSRTAWLAGGALAMGVGIWSMHFVGMLAFRLPTPVAYEVTRLALSVVVAVAASLLALSVVSRGAVSVRSLALGGLLMGMAIAGMHYVGMASMRPGPAGYAPGLVAASLAIAVVASWAALWLGYRLRQTETPAGRWARGGAAVVMGAAIYAMHYTAMVAARFGPMPLEAYVDRRGVLATGVLATGELAAAVIIATLIILGLALLGGMIDRRLRLQASAAEREAQLRRDAENARDEATRLADELQQQATVLEQQVEEAQALAEELEQTNEQLQAAAVEAEEARERAETSERGLLERSRRDAFGNAVGAAITEGGALGEVLQRCAAAVVEYLDAAFARIWTLDERDSVLVLQASAGIYTNLDGRHSRIPVGAYKIGRIAEERQPHLTNQVQTDPRVSDPEWAQREGMVAFAGYPLLVGQRLVGVLAMFARQPLGENTLDAMRSTADRVALAIDQRRAEEALRLREQRYRALVEAGAQIVWTADSLGLVEDMPEWRRLTGQTPDEVRGRGWADAIHPDDRARAAEVELRAYQSRTAYEAEYRVRTADGSYRWVRARGVPVVSDDGTIREWVGTFTDIDDRARAVERQAFLADASAALGESLDVDTTLVTITRLAVSGLADGCLITLVEEDGTFRHAPVASRDPVKAALVEDLIRRFPLPPDTPSGYPNVIRTGRSELVDPRAFEESVLPGIAQNAEHLALLRQLDMYSGMVVPLIARGRTLGAITFVRHSPERRPLFTGADLGLAEELGRRAALAVDNARLYREAAAARAEAERARQAAEEARQNADAASRAKSEFLATMSHEVRTPINAITGYAQLLELGIAGPITEQQRDYLSRLRTSSAHLLGLVNEVLDLAKVGAGQMTVAREHALVGRAVRAALTLTLPQAEARGVRVFDYTGKEVVPYVGDEHRVRQILVNLLSNAIKFTEPGGSLTISSGAGAHVAPGARVSGGGPWAFIRVEDTGIGIAPAQQAAVFEPFVQAERGHTRSKGGTGLGLAISRQLARLMGGDLMLERSEPGRGSVFTLWLPAVGAADDVREGAAERSARVRQEVTGHRVHGLAEVGARLRTQVEQLVEAYVSRLRSDPVFPGAGGRQQLELEDHVITFLGNLAQSLVIVEQTGGLESHLLEDGGEIQRVISELHGRQRYRLGWSEAQLEREYVLLAEEIESFVRRWVPEGDGDVTTAIAVLRQLMSRATRTSARAFRHAAQSAPE